MAGFTSDKFPDMTEKEWLRLELSQTIRWLESQIKFFTEQERPVAVLLFEARLADVKIEYQNAQE